MITLKRGAVLAAPAAVPAAMALVFRWLSHRLSPQAAYNTGFIIYWLAGCIGFPMVVLGPRRAARLLTQGRRPSGVEMLLLILPAAGAVSSELLPNRNKIDGMLAAVMATTGVINATGRSYYGAASFSRNSLTICCGGGCGRLSGSHSGISYHR
jgi:hypothetical protein